MRAPGNSAGDGADRDAFQKIEGFGRLNHYDRSRLGGVRSFAVAIGTSDFNANEVGAVI